MRFLLTLLILAALLPGSYAQATEYSFEIVWSVGASPDIDLAGFRIYDLQNNEICATTDPTKNTLVCTVDIPGTQGTYTLVSYSTDGIESDPSEPFTINFDQTSSQILAAIILVTTTDGSLAVSFDASTSTGTPTSYTWDFNDGSAAVSAPTTNHTFPGSGTYTVFLTVQGDSGASDQTSHDVTVRQSLDGNQAPTASLVVTSSVLGDVPLTVAFDGSGSSDTEDSTLTYSWDFGDGTIGGNSSRITHQYLSAGTFTATLTVTDSQGVSSSVASQPIMVTTSEGDSSDATPTAVITLSGISGTVPVLINFSGSNSKASELTGTITQYSWNFGDGSTGTGKDVQHTYMDHGSYTVQLTVTDSLGKQIMTSMTVQTDVKPANKINPILIQVYNLMILEE